MRHASSCEQRTFNILNWHFDLQTGHEEAVVGT
jgi:hypothetical protein